MGHLKEITEENLPNIVNRYYRFGEKELKVGDMIGMILLETSLDGESQQMEIHTYVVDDGGIAYVLTDKK
jgi:hypothetical protein